MISVYLMICDYKSDCEKDHHKNKRMYGIKVGYIYFCREDITCDFQFTLYIWHIKISPYLDVCAS